MVSSAATHPASGPNPGWVLVTGASSGIGAAISREYACRGVPLILTADGASDLVRLEAFRAGVRDFVPRPFLDEEMVIRVHRATSTVTAGIGLRGALVDVALGTLLSLFEFERKSGVLLVMNGPDAARLFVSEGRICKIEGGGGGVARERLMRVLDWTVGQFEFSAGPVQVVDELGLATTNILLQHAQSRDETAE